MSSFITERLVPRESVNLLSPCCQSCERRKDCPFVYDQIARRAVYQGHGSARFLASEADRLQETVSGADNVCQLLRGDRDLERALSRALCLEMALMDDLCAQRAKYGS